MTKMKIAGVQMDIEFNNRDGNLNKMQERLEETTSNGAQLTVFPECTTTGSVSYTHLTLPTILLV